MGLGTAAGPAMVVGRGGAVAIAASRSRARGWASLAGGRFAAGAGLAARADPAGGEAGAGFAAGADRTAGVGAGRGGQTGRAGGAAAFLGFPAGRAGGTASFFFPVARRAGASSAPRCASAFSLEPLFATTSSREPPPSLPERSDGRSPRAPPNARRTASVHKRAMPNVRRLDDMTAAEVAALDKARALCTVAFSALEVHGPHLPLGADLHQAAYIADEVGARFAAAHPDWTVVRHPPVPIGSDELPLPGSIETPPRAVYAVARALLESLARAGFRHVFIANAHGGPRHASALEAAARDVSRRRRIAAISPCIRVMVPIVQGERLAEIEAVLRRPLREEERAGVLGGEHAGTWETGWYLAFRPELPAPRWKELGAAMPPAVPWIKRLGEWLARRHERRGRSERARRARRVVGGLAHVLGWLANARWGWYGDPITWRGWPAVASPELGRVYAELIVRGCLADLEAVLGGALRPEDVRSIMSDIAFLQPSFPRRVAACALLAAAIGALVILAL